MPAFKATKLSCLFFLLHCDNNPYKNSEKGQNIYYTSFREEPKHLDPAIAYSSDEYTILSQIYEPPLQYHFLKRPFELTPLTLKKMPKISPSLGGGVAYTLEFRKDIYYQEHPAFATDENKKYIYHLNPGEVFSENVEHPNQLEHKGKRLLTAHDYAYQIKRLAYPKVPSPIYVILKEYITGFGDFSKELEKEIIRVRKLRKQKKGDFYNQEMDEKRDPLYIDLRKFEMMGLEVIDDFILKIRLKKKYPQFIYWLAMPFFSPMPWEVIRFYTQSAAADQNLTLDRFPVGSGPYVLEINRPNYRMVLLKNPSFHEESFPKKGEASDAVQGFLDDAGKKLPFLDKVVYTLEKESIPRWNKFLQGYYDNSGVGSEVFDSAVVLSAEGVSLTRSMQGKGIQLSRVVTQTTYYYAFNMLDDLLGGYSEKKRKLRQAISIALDVEEYIQIFLNGRGVPAHGPIPPGIFGYQSNKEGMNKTVYVWDEKRNEYKRKSIDLAKKLLSEAGYPGGKNSKGSPLVLYYDKVQSGASDKAEIDWMRKQFRKLNIDLQIRSTDYNQFRAKVRKGNYQILRWGWHADYPDPENFLALLYGPNGKVASNGENVANYKNLQYDSFFRRLERIENTPRRALLIRKALDVVKKDSPWIWGFHPIAFNLYHSWYKNAKPMEVGSMNILKYKRIDAKQREEFRGSVNQPVLYPIWIILIIFFSIMSYSIWSKKTLGQRKYPGNHPY